MRQETLRPGIIGAARGTFIACLATVAMGSAAKANPHQNLLIAGGQYSTSSQSVYLGSITPLAGGTLGDGYFISPFVGWNRYTFQKNGQTFTGSEPTASLGIGRGWKTKHFDLSLSVAGGYANTNVSPYAPSGSLHGGKWFVEPEIYAHASLPRGVSFTFNGGYLTGLRSYWASTYILVPVTSSFSVGPEADFGGGINYRNHAFALRVSDKVTNSLVVNASAGALTNIPGSYHPYFALNLSVPFQ